MSLDALVETLLSSDIASIRYKIRVNVLGEDATSQSIVRLRDEIKRSEIVCRLLARQDDDGRIATRSPYDKWQGAHWVLATLADIGYPEGDASLAPVRDQLQSWWLHEKYYREFEAYSRAAEIFLKRQLYRRQSGHSLISRGFVELHYPLYWHYDLLHGLKVLADALFVPKSAGALDALHRTSRVAG